MTPMFFKRCCKSTLKNYLLIVLAVYLMLWSPIAIFELRLRPGSDDVMEHQAVRKLNDRHVRRLLAGQATPDNKSSTLLQTNLSDIPLTCPPQTQIDDIPVKLGSRSRSIAFLKTFKVGGTTISSMLNAYAFNTNQMLEKVDNWCRGRSFSRKNHCTDIIGTNHPKVLPCNYPSIQSASFCKPAEVFMMLREPTDRLWSGYKHEVKIAESVFPLSRFLQSKTVVKTPSHHLLSKTTSRAIERTSDINILLHHLYDESLVYMAMKTGMKLCDIMYVPCDSASWGATKCNTQTNVTMSEQDKKDLTAEAFKSGELEFYNAVYKQAEKKLTSHEITTLTKKYRLIRTEALKRCQMPGVLDSITSMLHKHPYIKQDNKNERLYHYQTELTNPLDPLTVCLGWYCFE